MLYRYAELSPDELTRALAACPVAWCPWGALEWHGPHLPLGLDGLVVERFAEGLAEAVGGVLLPTTWLPITALPHPMSLSVRPEALRAVWADLFAGLKAAGAEVVCLVSGHYAQGHEMEMAAAAEEAMEAHGLRVLAASPLALLEDESLLDHAARWETAQLMAVRPDLVHVERYPGAAGPKESGALGDDPRDATPEEGAAVLQRAQAAWADWVRRLLADPDPAPLRALYASRRALYQDYVNQFYKTSWEQALADWWRDKE